MTNYDVKIKLSPISKALQNNGKKNFKRKVHIETIVIDKIIIQLEELLTLQQLNYEPYNEKQTKIAIRALLNIRGIKNLKAFNQ